MNIFNSIQLIVLIITIVINVILASVVFRSDKKSATNQIFSFLSISITVWIIINYISITPYFLDNSLLWIRLTIFFSVPMSVLFLILAKILPSKKFSLKKRNIIILGVLSLITMVVCLSPYAFTGVEVKDNSSSVTPGPGLALFGIFSIICNLSAIYYLIKRYRNNIGTEKRQLLFVMLGVLLMFGLIILTVFIPVALFKISIGVSFIPIYTLIFLGLTAYAIIKHHLFNIKVIATEAFVIILWLVLFAKIFVTPTTSSIIIDSFIFLVTIPFGILLIKSVIKEVSNAHQQYEMVATVSHQLRTPLTPIVGLASMIVEGDFNNEPDKRLDAEKKIFLSGKRLSNVINDFLEVFELEGDRKLDGDPVDMKDVIKEAIKGNKDAYEQHGLYLKFKKVPAGLKTSVRGERGLLVQAISNLIDNAGKYTEKGGTSISIQPHHSGGFQIFVADTGIGVAEEDRERMFQKFFRSQQAKTIRADGSGLGLPIVKKIIEAHGGKIHFESAGVNKGTTFVVTFANGTRTHK